MAHNAELPKIAIRRCAHEHDPRPRQPLRMASDLHRHRDGSWFLDARFWGCVMGAQHTPGPWLIRKGDEWTCDIVTREGDNADGEPMYWNVASFNLRRDEAQANARLIAAAPDLLEALINLEHATDLPANSPTLTHYRGVARDAIAKATGEQA